MNSQVTQTIPMNSSRFEHPQDGVYFKDINNELDYFVGTWEGILDNKKYTFQFIKFVEFLETDLNDINYYYIDCIKVKFKVVDLTINQVLYDDTAITNSDDYKVSGIVLRGGTFWFSYNDVENCHNQVNFDIHKVSNQPNKLKYCYFSYYEFNPYMFDCPYENQDDIPMFLPKEDVILTKI